MSRFGQFNSRVVVGALEVFFKDEEIARRWAKKHDGKVKRLDDGWLVKIGSQPSSGNDPIVQAIKKSIALVGRASVGDSILDYQLPDGSRLRDHRGKVAPDAFNAMKRCTILIRRAERLEKRQKRTK